MVNLEILRDAANVPLYGIPLTDAGYVCALAADTATSLTVPAGARIAIFGFSSANDYWVGTATFSIPTASSFAAANILLNPPPLKVTGVTALWFRAPTACTISVAFYG